MTKFNFTAGVLVGLLHRYITVEDKTAINDLTVEIYKAAKDLALAFEYGVGLYDRDKKIVEKKSEMPCNCKHEDTAQEKAIDEALRR